MARFIYVFSEKDRDTLIEAGYNLLKSDKCHSTFIFKDDPELEFDLGTLTYVRSNVLTF